MLEGKVALVTGAGRGMGRAHALLLAKAGAHIVVNDLGGSPHGDGKDAGPAEEVVAEIVAMGGKAVCSALSVSEWTNAREIVATAVDKFGRLDIVVNNAGITRFQTFGDMDELGWNLPVNIMLKGTAAIINWTARHWRDVGREAGRAIINISSPAGPHPLPSGASYCASKAGIVALTQVAAQELAPLGVRANAVAPMARTRMMDAAPEMLALMQVEEGFDRYLPEHVAPLILYLASPSCKFTGRLFGIEGDDVFLFNEWSADHHASNAGRQWTVEELADALSSFDPAPTRWTLFPGGRVELPFPPPEVVRSLG